MDEQKITELIAQVRASIDALEAAVNGEEEQTEEQATEETPEVGMSTGSKKTLPFKKGGMNLMKSIGIE